MKSAQPMLSVPVIEKHIRLIRGQRVIMDSVLAALYGVETSALTRAVRRNKKRFPPDFLIQANPDEWRLLRCQFGISKPGRGGRRYLPYFFTEQGVAMLSSVLQSERAILANIAIMRAFVRLREIVSANREFARRLVELERRMAKGELSIKELNQVFQDLLRPALQYRPRPKRVFGFQIPGRAKSS